MAAELMDTMIDKIASECVAVRLRMLNRVITNIYDDALRSLDLKVSQMNILVAAARMGTARPIEVCWGNEGISLLDKAARKVACHKPTADRPVIFWTLFAYTNN